MHDLLLRHTDNATSIGGDLVLGFGGQVEKNLYISL